MEPIAHRGDQYVPKEPGTVENLRFYFGPYTVPPGHDANRVDLELPMRNGFILAIEPGMRRVSDFSEPSHQEAHIHHAHWFALQPGNQGTTTPRATRSGSSATATRRRARTSRSAAPPTRTGRTTASTSAPATRS